MKRKIRLLVFVGIIALELGAIGVVIVLYFAPPPIIGNAPPPKKDPPLRDDQAPFTYEELEALQDKPANAAAEIPRLVACFEKDDEDVRLLAAEILSKIGAKAVQPVREKLTDANPKVRFCAVQTLALIGTPAADAANDLLARLKDDDADVRYKAVYALGKVGVRSDAVFTGLLAALQDKEENVTQTALEVLDEIDTPPKDALPMLAKLAARAATPPIRHAVIKLLGRLGESAVPALKDLLKQADLADPRPVPGHDANAVQLEEVIQAIGSLGPQAKPLIPDLVPIMAQQIKNVYIDPNLLDIFKKCELEGAKGLAEALKGVDRRTIARNGDLVKAFGEMRSPDLVKVTVPILIDLLKFSELPIRDTRLPGLKEKGLFVVDNQLFILEILGDIGPAAKGAIPTVQGLLMDQAVAEAARVALRRMGVFAKK